MANILLFAFMTFWIWGWILFWPTSKVKNDNTKGLMTTIGAVIFLASVIFNIYVFNYGGVSTAMDQARLFFSLNNLFSVWLPALLALVTIIIVFLIGGGSDDSDWTESFWPTFIVTLVFFVIYYFCGLVIHWFIVSYISPLIGTLL